MWDSGLPLSVEAEQRLVTPFRFTQSAGGGEIEFALARALAQSSGGTLRLRPRPGGGAEVVVTLPKSVLAPLARATAATPSLPKLRILVVDDDAVNRQAMRLLLEREGHEVVAVENGLEAIERLGPASDRFDAVVTDLQMPRLGGRALYEQLQEQRPQLAERFVFVTGDRARGVVRAARAFPNPAFSATYTKAVPQYHAIVDLPLDVPWLRAPRIGAAEFERDAVRYGVAFERAAIRFDAETSYTHALAAAAH